MPRSVERVSAVEHEYAGRRLKVGEAFQCDAIDVELLLALGRIKPERGERGYVEPEPQTYTTRAMTARRTKGSRA